MIGISKYINMILHRINGSKYIYYNDNYPALLHNIFKWSQFLITALRWMHLMHLWLLFLLPTSYVEWTNVWLEEAGRGIKDTQTNKWQKRNISLFFYCLVRGGWFSIVSNSSGISGRSEDSEEQLPSQFTCWEATLPFLSKPYSVADCKKLSGRVT